MNLSEVVLLGAGASKDAGLPDSFELTKRIVDRLNEAASGHGYVNEELQDAQKVVNFVLGGLLYKAAKGNANPTQTPVNVEEFFSAIDLLARRDQLEIAPFIRSWDPAVEALDTIQPPNYDLESAVSAVIEAASDNMEARVKTMMDGYSHSNWNTSIKSATRNLVNAINTEYSRSGEGRIFKNTAKLLLRYLGEILWLEELRAHDELSYLFPLLKQASSRTRRVIATLNYDNTIELAARDQGFRPDLGLETWSRTGSFGFTSPIGLLKVHGSLDWHFHRVEVREGRAMPTMDTIQQLDYSPKFRNSRGWDYEPCVIFGQQNKLRPDGPFLDLLQAFQRELSASSKLVVIGYSFGDSHINIQISRWLNGGTERELVIIDPGIETSRNSFVVDLIRYVPKERLVLVPRIAKEGIAEYFIKR